VLQLAYGHTVESDLDLGVAVGTGASGLRIERLASPVDVTSVTWLDRHSDPRLSVGLLHHAFYLRHADDAEFVISPDGREVYWRTIEAPPSTVLHLVLDHVLPRALTRMGRLVLHGSCVSVEDRLCVGIVGRSGAGKSTLAARLVADGLELIADDCVVVEPEEGMLRVTPAYPGLRLSETSLRLSGLRDYERRGAVSHYTHKVRVAPANGAAVDEDGRRYLRALVLLAHPDEPRPPSAHTTLTRLSPATAAVELLRNSFLLNRPEEYADALNRVLDLSPRCPVFSLRYDHSEPGLDRARADVLSLLQT